MDSIRDNPLPAAMVGVGLGWLLMNSRRHGRDERTPDYRAPDYGREGRRYRALRDSEDWGYEGSVSDEFTVREPSSDGNLAHRARDRAAEITHDARDAVSDLADRAHHRVDDARARAGSAAGRLARETRYESHRVQDRLETALQESPLAIGAAAAAIGMAIGLSAPSTRRESEWMGSMRDDVLDRARVATKDAGEKVREVAGRVADEARSTAREAAREQHLL